MTHVADAGRLPRQAIAHVALPGVANRIRLLIAITNYAALRRALGCAASATLSERLAQRIALVLPEAHISPAGRDLVEVTFDSRDGEALATATAAVTAACEVAFPVAGLDVAVRVVIGGAAGAVDGDEVSLSEAAEAALVRSGRAESFCTGVTPLDEAQQLAIELDRAIACDELLLVYQPKVHVRRQEVTSVEALIRWQHPDRGMVLPGDFITAAEQAQRIDRLTLWTIARAIRDQRTLRERGHDLRVFINISGQLLADTGFANEVCALVQAAPDTSIGFEVTETSVIRDPAGAIANLNRFDAIGIRISIDDYGAGLSSLAYLKQMPARELKIDKLFVTQLTSSNRDPLIVRSTIDLAHALDMEVVAEGVETAAALALLSVMGCDQVQGYFISRPIPLDGLIDFLGDESRRHAAQHTRTSFLRLASAWKRA
ncbi:MAG: EAL domain-containing protein [Sphingomonas adhaesiva]|uniref:EAL domain-containing protein n=1 Tax=Sphingomonas adhaesiva TaxID=28212 RepID=UPI002FF8D4F7